MDPNQSFNALFEQYVFRIAQDVVGDATPAQQKNIIDLLLSIDTTASTGSPDPLMLPVNETSVALKTLPKKSRRSPVDKRIEERQLRRGILELSIEQNQRQITNAIANISLVEQLIVQAENTLLNHAVKVSVITRYQRAIDIYNNQLHRLQDVKPYTYSFSRPACLVKKFIRSYWTT